jgi:hypothetical protein
MAFSVRDAIQYRKGILENVRASSPYSRKFRRRFFLQEMGRHSAKQVHVHVCTYQSLTNEVTIKDIAEGVGPGASNMRGTRPR